MRNINVYNDYDRNARECIHHDPGMYNGTIHGIGIMHDGIIEGTSLPSAFVRGMVIDLARVIHGFPTTRKKFHRKKSLIYEFIKFIKFIYETIQQFG